MKLNVLYESYDDALDSMYRYLDGLGIVDSAVRKFLGLRLLVGFIVFRVVVVRRLIS